MSELLGDDAPKNSMTYRNWFINPEKYVNGAFLDRERSNPKRWMMVVSAMQTALSNTLMIAVDETREFIALYKEREAAISRAIEVYLNNLERTDIVKKVNK